MTTLFEKSIGRFVVLLSASIISLHLLFSCDDKSGSDRRLNNDNTKQFDSSRLQSKNGETDLKNSVESGNKSLECPMSGKVSNYESGTCPVCNR